jgi:hypothetical protein
MILVSGAMPSQYNIPSIMLVSNDAFTGMQAYLNLTRDAIRDGRGEG